MNDGLSVLVNGDSLVNVLMMLAMKLDCRLEWSAFSLLLLCPDDISYDAILQACMVCLLIAAALCWMT